MLTSRNLRAGFAGLLLFVLFLAPCSGLVYAQSDVPSANPPDEAYALRVPGVVYVQFRMGYVPGTEGVIAPGTIDPVRKIFQAIGVTSVTLFDPVAWKDSISHLLGIDRIYVVNYTTAAHPLGVVVKLLQTGLVETASPRYIFKYQSTPNDPDFDQQYYIKNVQADKAWDITRGDSNIVIADVDAGVNYNHEDLAANIKYNAGEIGLDAQGHDKRTNGIDDDGDGAIDNWRGWDAAGESTNGIPMPDNDPYPEDIQWYGAGHGTFTTGCFGAVQNNNLGISGVAPLCKILAVKIGDAHERLIAAYEGVHYAAAHGAKVINCSWGGLVDGEATAFQRVFSREITMRGEVMVAAAGNYSLNNDIMHFYPAYLKDVLSVGATDQNNNPSSFTHYGHSVKVFAPGVGIHSTSYPGNNLYEDEDGTSFSSPITAGIVALVMAKHPKYTPQIVQRQIIQTCDDVLGRDRYLWWGRVNAFNAVNVPGGPGLGITNFTVNGVTGGPIDNVATPTSVSVDFYNSAEPGTNVTATLQPGPGYTWDRYDPLHNSNWPTALLGIIDSEKTASGRFDIIRTGQYSEGQMPLTFYVTDPASYHDTLHVTIPLTKKPGMTEKLAAAHATSVKQVDAKTGWAGFGYYLRVHDPERKTDSTILISQFSKRDVTGTWSAPQDILNGDSPIHTIDATDNQHAWFAGNTLFGQSVIFITNDGGQSWNSATSTGNVSNIRSIHFFDNNNGIIIGDASSNKWEIAVTNDGGQTWSAGANVSSTKPNEHGFYNNAFWNGKRGWFGTDNKEIYMTTDRGASWKSYSGFLNANAKENNIATLAFSSDNAVGYAVIRPYGLASDSASFWTSPNGGFSWSRVALPDINTIPYSVTFIPGTTTAIVTTNQGVFQVANPTAPWTTYLGAPTSWDPRFSFVSAGGVANAYTISAVSEPSGIVDYSVGVNAVSSPGGQPIHTISVQNAPNPFSNLTTLYLDMPAEEHVKIEVYDVLGRVVSNVFDGSLGQGPHAIPIAASELSPGVYHYSVTTQFGERIQKSMVVVR